MSPEEISDDRAPHRVGSDVPFFAGISVLISFYIALILAMLIADSGFTSLENFRAALASEEIRYAIKLSLISSTITAILSLWVAVPTGYILARFTFRGKAFVDAILDIPIVLPPLVIGLSLLVLFATKPGMWANQLMLTVTEWLFGAENAMQITYDIPAVILAQFLVACAFAVRTMRATFDQMDSRQELVALTLGCTRSQAFWNVVLPEARPGILTAGTLAWARALGEFGPILIFAGSTRMRTEVMPTTIQLELTVANIESAVAVSLLMVVFALVILVTVRLFGRQRLIR